MDRGQAIRLLVGQVMTLGPTHLLSFFFFFLFLLFVSLGDNFRVLS